MNTNRESKQHEAAKMLIVMPKLVKPLIGSFKPQVDIVLKKNEIKALMELAIHPNMPMKYYLDFIGIESGSFTYLVDKLEQKELVNRVQAENDKRISVLTLSEKGKKITDLLQKQFDDHIAKQLSRLKEEDLDKLLEAAMLLEQVLQKLIQKDMHKEKYITDNR